MTINHNKTSHLSKKLLEMAKDMWDIGILDEAVYEKITMRHLGIQDKSTIEPLTGEGVKGRS